MGIYYHKATDNFQLGIWKMEESMDQLKTMVELSTMDATTFNNFKSEYRKSEWLTTRVLVQQLLKSTDVHIAYSSNGKPKLVNSDYAISISHTKNFVAVLLSKESVPGIDLETVQPRIEKISKKFVTDDELSFIEDDKASAYKHVIWGAKEVLFKIYADGELNFLEHLHIDKFSFREKGRLNGRIEKNNFSKKFVIFYEQLGELMLVYASA
jgi:4'-phosphopantetheinyl transferase